MAELTHSLYEMKVLFLSLAPLSRCFCTFWCPHLPSNSIIRKIGKFPTVRVGVAQKTDFSDTKVATNFFPPNAFLRRRRKKALLRVNDRGGGSRMCILGLYRVYVRACVRAGTTGTSAVNLRRYGDTPQTITIYD